MKRQRETVPNRSGTTITLKSNLSISNNHPSTKNVTSYTLSWRPEISDVVTVGGSQSCLFIETCNGLQGISRFNWD